MSVRRLALLASLSLVACIVVFALGSPQWAPVAEALPPCGDFTLDGNFSYHVDGVAPGGAPYATVGTFSSDGAGTITGSGISAEDGLLDAPGAFTCPYVMTPDCTFSALCVDVDETDPSVRMDGAVADGRKQVHLLITSHPGATGGGMATGVATKW